MKAREVLNKIKWTEEEDLASVEIIYKDRITGIKIIEGKEIISLERRYFNIATTRLPYYKILKIIRKYKDEKETIIWERSEE